MDRKLLLLINQQWTSPLLDRCMAVLSSFDLWAPLLVAGVLWGLVRGSARVRILLLVAGLAAGVSDGVVSRTLKIAIARPRPAQALADVRQVDLAKAKPRLLALGKPMKVTFSKSGGEVTGRSFPSSHTMNTAAVAIVVALLFPRWGWLGLAVPLGVGYSRIYTGAHWPSDVLISWVLGAGVGLLCATAAEALWRWRGASFFPKAHGAQPQLFAA